jgi:hypothetical protein
MKPPNPLKGEFRNSNFQFRKLKGMQRKFIVNRNKFFQNKKAQSGVL